MNTVKDNLLGIRLLNSKIVLQSLGHTVTEYQVNNFQISFWKIDMLFVTVKQHCTRQLFKKKTKTP